MIIIGSGLLILSCLMAAPSASLVSLAIALYLLGLGWNFAYVAGSTLLADELSPTERAKTPGFNDLMLGVASAAGSFGGGMMFAASGYWSLGLAGALAALVPLGLAVWWQARRRLAPSAHT